MAILSWIWALFVYLLQTYIMWGCTKIDKYEVCLLPFCHQHHHQHHYHNRLLPITYCLLPGCQCAGAIIININITIVSIHVFLFLLKNSMPTTRVKMANKIFKVGRNFFVIMKGVFFDIEDNNAHYYPRYQKIYLSLNHDQSNQTIHFQSY